MPSISAIDSIEINVKPQLVFDIVSDYGNARIWLDNYECEVLGEGPIKEGTKVAHRVRKMVKFTRVIDRIVPGERLEELYIEGDLKGTGIWAFEATKAGTLASFDCKVSSQAWLPHIGFLLTGNKSHKDAYAKLLSSLKKHCEAL